MALYFSAPVAEAGTYSVTLPISLAGVMAFCAIVMILGLCARSDNSISSNDVAYGESDGEEYQELQTTVNFQQPAAAGASSKLQASGRKLLSKMKPRPAEGGAATNKNLPAVSCSELRAMEEAAAAYGMQSEGEEESWSGPLWRRTILMGEKCEPPAFSGLILYDSNGNRIPQFPAKLSKPVTSDPSEFMQLTIISLSDSSDP